MRRRKLTVIILTIIIAVAAVGVLAYTNGWIGGSNAPSVPADTMTRGLVGYWSFDGGVGQIAYDASGNGNNGTIHGAKWTRG